MTTNGHYIISQYLLLIVFVSLILILLVSMGVIVSLIKNRNVEKNKYKSIERDYDKLKFYLDDNSNKIEKLKERNETARNEYDKMRNFAYTDNLTDLPNESAFIEVIDSITLTIREDEIVGIMGLDIDDFKQINDSLGKTYGDELLIDIAHRLKQALDENDFLARIGGDEFAIISQNIESVEDFDEKIELVQKVFKNPFVLGTVEYFIDISIGAVILPKDGKTTKELVRNMFATIKAVKTNNKSSYLYYEKKFNDSRTEKIEFQSKLRHAIKNNEFVLLYQPIIGLDKKQLIGFESLLRWIHPDDGLVLPESFIKQAEENGLIRELGYWGIRTACDQLKTWQDQGYIDATISVNLSSRQLRDKNIISVVKQIIEETGVDHSKLEFEFTEKTAMKDKENVLFVLNEFKALGISLSLDDFGTGYSSVNFLREIPITNLKIDNKLMENLLEDGRSKMVVGAIITLGKYLGYSIIAEGVERTDQEEFLELMKCNKVQGYLYHHPLTGEEASDLLKKEKNREDQENNEE